MRCLFERVMWVIVVGVRLPWSSVVVLRRSQASSTDLHHIFCSRSLLLGLGHQNRRPVGPVYM